MYTRKVSLELGIDETFARDWVIVVVAPYSELRPVHPVFPYSVRSVTEPLLTFDVSFGHIEFYSHEVYHTVEAICVDKTCSAVGRNVPFHLLK